MFGGKRVLFYELNEVPYRVISDFARSHPKSSIAQILRESRRYETVAEDNQPLSPWVTWTTLDRGVGADTHGVSNLGQDLTEVNRHWPSYLSLLAKAGVKVGMFGQMHSHPLPPDAGVFAFYVPSSFATGPECHPAKLSVFQAFNLAMVGASGRNVSKGLMLGAALPFLRHAFGLGVRMSTACAIGWQVVSERIWKARSCRRRTIHSRLGFDVFCKQLSVAKPDFAVFFTNHVAANMHRYWPAKYPEDYTEFDPGDAWRSTYKDEIDASMREADRQLGVLKAFADRHDYQIFIAGSMGQAAVDGAEPVKTQLYLGDLGLFMASLGVSEGAWVRKPSMQPRYILEVGAEFKPGFLKALASLKIDGKPFRFSDEPGGIVKLDLGQINLRDDAEVDIGGRACSLSDIGLTNTVIEDESGSYAFHVPEGVLLAYERGREGAEAGTMSTLEIAPSILTHFGVKPPPYMRAPRHL